MGVSATTNAAAGVELDRETQSRVERAWEVRRSERPPVMRLDTVRATRAVSVTGTACGADCAHCGGHYLRGMLSPSRARRAATTGKVQSWLVSGGCTPDGRVPLAAEGDLLVELGRSARLNLHTGLVRTDEEARFLAGHASAVSLDFTVDDRAVAEVYGFTGVSGRDFVRAYELLSAHAPVTPHVLIGLHAGRIRGELEALRRLARMGARAVVLLVFIPTPGSRYGNVPPPPLAEVARVMAEARLLFPDRPVHLGCMRPKGSYREALDLLAVRAGLDRVAVPTPASVSEAARLGLSLIWSEECCVF